MTADRTAAASDERAGSGVLDANLLQRAVEVHQLELADAYLVASAERTGIGIGSSRGRTRSPVDWLGP